MQNLLYITGLKYYKDLAQPVPREEAIKIKDIVVEEVGCMKLTFFFFFFLPQKILTFIPRLLTTNLVPRVSHFTAPWSSKVIRFRFIIILHYLQQCSFNKVHYKKERHY